MIVGNEFYIVAAGVEAALWPLVIVLVATSVIGLFYYLRVVVELYADAPQNLFSPGAVSSRAASQVALSALMLALLVFGVYPGPLMEVLRNVTGQLLH